MKKLIKRLENLNIICSKYEKVFSKNLESLKEEYSILTVEELKKSILDMENKERNLKIGIVGRVKAGKSSLLNSLFFDGKDILPKAATPMTAALTIIRYSDKFSAEIDFYTSKDIKEFISDAEIYDKKFEEKYNLEVEILTKRNIHSMDKVKEIAKKNAKNELLKNIKLDSAKDQYERMLKQPAILKDMLSDNNANINNKIDANTLEDLQKIIIDYVGSEGKYMPFTKSITVNLPIEILKGIEIIDTPGVNDPVQSREQRTRQLLKDCDVTLIVSPTGQFLSEDDKVLMSRISNKEGINEIYIVGSQVDNILFSNEKNLNNSNIPNILKSINMKLKNQMIEILSKLELESGNSVYGKIIKDGEIFLTSGMANSIKLNLENGNKLNEEQEYLLNRLKSEYQQYFSKYEETIQTLNLIGNIENIFKTLNNIKLKKEDILSKRKEEFLNIKINSFNEFKQELLESLEESKLELESADIDSISKELKVIDQKRNNLELSIEELLADELSEFKIKLKEYVSNEIRKLEKEIDMLVNSNVERETEEYQVEKKGFFSGVARFFGVGGYTTKYKTHLSLDTDLVESQLKRKIDTTVFELNDNIDSINMKFKKSIIKQISRAAGEILEDNIDFLVLKKNIRQSINEIKNENINISVDVSGEIGYGGVLRSSSQINAYSNQIRTFLVNLIPRMKEDINKYNENLENNMTAKKILQKILNDLENERKELAENIKNKKEVLNMYENSILEIKKL